MDAILTDSYTATTRSINFFEDNKWRRRQDDFGFLFDRSFFFFGESFVISAYARTLLLVKSERGGGFLVVYGARCERLPDMRCVGRSSLSLCRPALVSR